MRHDVGLSQHGGGCLPQDLVAGKACGFFGDVDIGQAPKGLFEQIGGMGEHAVCQINAFGKGSHGGAILLQLFDGPFHLQETLGSRYSPRIFFLRRGSGNAQQSKGRLGEHVALSQDGGSGLNF